MHLEHYDDGAWRHVGTINLAAGCRFLERLRRPQPWRLRGGGKVYKARAFDGRVIWWPDTAEAPAPVGHQ
jgi:hypothetical protein